jgi:hypothetical protein
VWWSTSIIPAAQEVEIGGSQSEASLVKSSRPYPKKLKAKRTESIVQVVECCLPGSLEALRKKNKKKTLINPMTP